MFNFSNYLQERVDYTIDSFAKNINFQAEKIITLRDALQYIFEIKECEEFVTSYSASLRVFTEQYEITILWYFSAEFFDRDWINPKEKITFDIFVTDQTTKKQTIKKTSLFEEIIYLIEKMIKEGSHE